MAEIYLMPGLGLDDRIFSNLKFEAPSVIHLKWIEPLNDENLSSYVLRIANQISSDQQPKILIGHSFGGFIVQELSKVINTKKIIIISSIKHEREMPIFFKALRVLPLHFFITKKIIKNTLPLWLNKNGFTPSKRNLIFMEMFDKNSNFYFKWAVNQLVNWTSKQTEPIDVVHIHGNKDKTFPIRNIKNVIEVKNGNHLMVWNRSKQISQIINDTLK